MSTTSDEIANPRTGQRMRFCPRERERLQIETVNPPGPPEPEHVHPFQESGAQVLSGTLHFSVRGNVRVVHAGEQITIPANVPHYFWNEGPEDAVAIQEFRPALRTEEFFRIYFGLTRDGKTNDHGMPSLLPMIVLLREFSDVIRPTNPPWTILRLLAFLLRPVARLRGYESSYRHYLAPTSAEAREAQARA